VLLCVLVHSRLASFLFLMSPHSRNLKSTVETLSKSRILLREVVRQRTLVLLLISSPPSMALGGGCCPITHHPYANPIPRGYNQRGDGATARLSTTRGFAQQLFCSGGVGLAHELPITPPLPTTPAKPERHQLHKKPPTRAGSGSAGRRHQQLPADLSFEGYYLVWQLVSHSH
jgi:hypothetical protein